MKLSQLKIEPHLVGAFLSHLKRSGYQVTPLKHKRLDKIEHPESEHLAMTPNFDDFGNLIIPTSLLRVALDFLRKTKVQHE